MQALAARRRHARRVTGLALALDAPGEPTAPRSARQVDGGRAVAGRG
jgi:hypothetical protein